MSKRQYFNIAMSLPLDWVASCAANPSASMRPIHIALMRLAIRKRTRK